MRDLASNLAAALYYAQPRADRPFFALRLHLRYINFQEDEERKEAWTPSYSKSGHLDREVDAQRLTMTLCIAWYTVALLSY